MSLIQIKRGLSTNLGALVLQPGELAVATDTGKLYVGNGSDKVLINPTIASNAASATVLETARLISITGSEFNVTAASFDGSANVNIGLALAASGVVAGTYGKVTVNSKGIVTAGADLEVADLPTIPSSKISGLGTVISLNTGILAGNVPVLDANGKLNTAVLPDLAIIETHVVADEAAMVALVAQQGDVAVRLDLEKTFILANNSPELAASWVQMLSPTDKILTVNGRVGNVVIVASDVGLENVTNESKATMFTNPTFTGTVIAPTVATSDDSDKVATTAFVKAQQYLVASSTIDGGTF
jgi:hypothetical protein